MESGNTTPISTRICAECIERLLDRDRLILSKDGSMFTRILYPTDGSDVAEYSLDWAIDLAESTGSEIFVLHVVEDGKRLDHSGLDILREIGEEFVQKACKKIEERGIVAHPTVVDGKPYHEIINFAKSEAIEMIVMGTHGVGGLSRALLGSVADRVIRTSSCPVLLVPAMAEKVKDDR